MKTKKQLFFICLLVVVSFVLCSCNHVTTDYDGKYYLYSINEVPITTLFDYYKTLDDEEARAIGETDPDSLYLLLDDGKFTMTGMDNSSTTGELDFDGNKVKLIVKQDGKDAESEYYTIEDSTITINTNGTIAVYKKR